MMTKQQLISFNLSLGGYASFVDKILALGAIRQSSYVCVANVHMCIEAYQDSAFCQLVNEADLVTPDGKPLVVSLKWLYGIQQDKVSGPDLMPSLLAAAETQSQRVFLYGATPSVLEAVVAYCTQKYPNLAVVGAISPPFRALSETEQAQDIQTINDSGANLVFVALGCPKQEKWMASMKGKIHAIMLGVGGAFPMLVGAEKRAPKWMQENGLEWFYRLLQDPKRLFKRYLVTNSMFIYLVLKEKVKILFFSKSQK